jgi:hypothetical protein
MAKRPEPNVNHEVSAGVRAARGGDPDAVTSVRLLQVQDGAKDARAGI